MSRNGFEVYAILVIVLCIMSVSASATDVLHLDACNGTVRIGVNADPIPEDMFIVGCAQDSYRTWSCGCSGDFDIDAYTASRIPIDFIVQYDEQFQGRTWQKTARADDIIILEDAYVDHSNDLTIIIILISIITILIIAAALIVYLFHGRGGIHG